MTQFSKETNFQITRKTRNRGRTGKELQFATKEEARNVTEGKLEKAERAKATILFTCTPAPNAGNFEKLT